MPIACCIFPRLTLHVSGLPYGQVHLYTVARTAERSTESCCRVSHLDTLNRGIRSSGQEQKTNEDQNDVEDGTSDTPDTSAGDVTRAVVCTSHAQVRDTPEDEAEETVE
jgi:hypothetical protein